LVLTYGYAVKRKPKSRSDDTIRIQFANQSVSKVSSLRDLEIVVTVPIRRLKPAVNKVSSLCDFMVALILRIYTSTPQNNISPFISLFFTTFAPELKVDRFVLLATTGKNAKNPSLPFGYIFQSQSIHYIL